MIWVAFPVCLSKLSVLFEQKGGGTGKKGLASQLSLDCRARRSG